MSKNVIEGFWERFRLKIFIAECSIIHFSLYLCTSVLSGISNRVNVN
jgi:hypothetical protein